MPSKSKFTFQSQQSDYFSRPERRTNDDREHLVLYLMFQVPFFETYPKQLVTSIADHMYPKVFPEGKKFIQRGDDGDCMFVTIKGESGIFLTDSALAAADAVVGPNRVIGDTALNVNRGEVGKRGATVIALKEVTALVLYRQDFQNIVY